jgi:murein DD-endopeptidase MepM/ murein hydrolase activator NlpD
MSFTLLLRSKKLRFVYNVQKRDLLFLAVIAILLTLWGSQISVSKSDTDAAIVRATQTGLTQQKHELVQIKTETEEKLTGMVLKLAEIQSQMQRLNALGSRLVDQANLAPEEFQFDELPALGGPTHEVTIDLPSSDYILDDIGSMLANIEDKQQQLQALESIMMNHHIDEQSYLTGRPISKGWLSSYYGIRKDPFSGLPAMHKGLDFAGKEGSDVVATGAGLVVWSGQRYGYGQLIEIDHGDGLTTRYGHNKLLKVKVGDVVTKGDVIGEMGRTGRATGAHVHYEVLKNGKQLDPLPYVSRKKNNS